MKTILASASPSRKKILENLGIKFEVIPADINEENSANFSAEKLVQYLAEEKAKTVYKKFKQMEDIIILGFDSVVEFDGEIIGKIKTKKSALETFQKYRGQTVNLLSGISIFAKFRGKFYQKTDFEVSQIYFRKETTNCQIRDFLSYNDWQGKAGGIAVEGASAFFIKKIEGDWNNILGLPVLKMNEMVYELTGKPSIKIFAKN